MKKNDNRFCISFNPIFPKHQFAIDALNSCGRNKSHLIAESLYYYLNNQKGNIQSCEASLPKENLIAPKPVLDDIKVETIKNEQNNLNSDFGTIENINDTSKSDTLDESEVIEEVVSDDISEDKTPTTVEDFEKQSISALLEAMSGFDEYDD